MVDLAGQLTAYEGVHALGTTVPYHAPAPTPKAKPKPVVTATPGQPQSARAIVQATLDQYGLGSLSNWAWDQYTSAGGGQTGLDAITANITGTKEFKTRFPAYQKLAEEGRAMTVQQMLQYEQTARQIFQANGIPGGFYDKPDELAQFMLNDVSTTELETRVKDAQQAMISSPQDVRDQLSNLYGVDHGHLTAFFLDPTKAEPIIAQKFTAAQIAAEAGRTGFGQLNATQAEGLAQLGVTDATAQSGFQQLGQEKGLFQAQTQGESQIGQQAQLAAQFGSDTAAQLAFQQRQAQRKAQFGEGAGFQVGQNGVGGVGPSERSA